MSSLCACFRLGLVLIGRSRACALCRLAAAAPGFELQTVYNGPATSHHLQALQPDTVHRLRVFACSEAGESATCASALFTTLPTAPAVPENVQCSAHLPQAKEGRPHKRSAKPTLASIAVQWAAPEAVAGAAQPASYEVCARAPGSQHPELSASVKTRRAVLRSAAYSTEYAVRVRSLGSVGSGCSEWSEVQLITTPAEPAVMPPIPPPSAATLAALQAARDKKFAGVAPRGNATSDAGSEAPSAQGRGSNPASISSRSSKATPRGQSGSQGANGISNTVAGDTVRRAPPPASAARPAAKLPAAAKRRRMLRSMLKRFKRYALIVLLVVAALAALAFKAFERWG